MNWWTAIGFSERGWGPALVEGALMTLLVSTAGLAIGGVLGSLVAWAKLYAFLPQSDIFLTHHNQSARPVNSVAPVYARTP
jgi:ABC-type amino acid transport system permease subunit